VIEPPSSRAAAKPRRGQAPQSALAGGPSDRRFSPYYVSDLSRWQRYEYKVLEARARDG
jgi:acyl-homoserine lactone acylase PvdQ